MKIDINYVGLVDDEEWPHFLWNVVINGKSFSYKTGIGNATKVVGKFGDLNKRPKVKYLTDKKYYVHVPKEDDVLYALVGDTVAGDMSFDDFCGDFGYSNDSIKSLNIYNSCAENGKKFRSAVGSEYYKLLERYQNGWEDQ